MNKTRVTTIVLASLVGVGGAWVLLPILSRHRALNAITHADESERRAGWTWLLVRDGNGQPRAAALLDRVNEALAGADDAPLVDGAAAMRASGLWGWDYQPPPVVVREMGLRAAKGEQLAVATQLNEAPLELDGELLLPLVNGLLQSEFDAARDGAFLAACGWAGPARGAWIVRLEPRGDDTDLHRARHLVARWCTPPPPPDALDIDAPADVFDAMLLRGVRFSAEYERAILALLRHPSVTPPVVTPDVLRYARAPEARRLLQRLADDGNRGAEFALQTRSADRDETQARLVFEDPAAPVAARRLAAWRWAGTPQEQVRTLLAADPADEDGAVYASALLAERRLPRAEAVAQAEAWIRSFNDDEKRAGALLSALLGTHADLLREAIDLEDIPRVRTVQRLALAALGVEIGKEDLDEFGFRVLHLDDGSLNADTLLCLLAAGRRDALKFLTRRPTGNAQTLGRAVQKQAWLIERFVPGWYAAVGRPIGSSVRGLRLYFDDLEAARMLMSRRIGFDPERRVFTAEGTASS